ncbi:MAG: hypothetical protein ACPG4T_15835, partial [Nannocystaceae bacterium]
EKAHECDPELTVGRAKVCAGNISDKLVDEAAKNPIDKANAMSMATAFVTHVGEEIAVGEMKYRFRPQRTRREVNAAVVTYLAKGKRRLEARLWNRAGTPGDEAMEVWITEYSENQSMIGWYKKRTRYKDLSDLRVLALNVPPFHRLKWTKKEKNVWSTTFGDTELEVIVGPNNSQLQLRNNGNYKGAGDIIPLQCGPAEELRDHALTFLRDFEYARSRKRAKVANADAEVKDAEPEKGAQKEAKKATGTKDIKKEAPPEPTPKPRGRKQAAKKKTAKKATKKSTSKKTANPVILDDDDDGATTDMGNVDVEKLLEKAADVASQIELPVMAD